MTPPSDADRAAAATTADSDPIPATPASDQGGLSSDQIQTDGEPAPPPPTRPSRVRKVSPRAITTAQGHEFVSCWFQAVKAHHDVNERNNGELHKRLSLNSLVILDHPADPGADGAGPWDQPERAHVAGAVIYWEAPRTIQTLRKLGDPNAWPGPPMHREWGVPRYPSRWR